jgi:hypothetical protein
MSHVFIAHVEEDADIALGIALGLEEAGYRTWCYEVDSVVGISYIVQTGEAVAQSDAVVVVISPHSLSSNQVTKEVVRAHESGRNFLPILRGISHVEFQQRQPEWREAIGSAASIRVPKEGVAALLPPIIEGIKSLRITPNPKVDVARVERLRKELDEIRARPLSTEAKVDITAKPKEEIKKPRSKKPLLISLASVIVVAIIVVVIVLAGGGGNKEQDQGLSVATTTSSPTATGTSAPSATPTTTSTATSTPAPTTTTPTPTPTQTSTTTTTTTPTPTPTPSPTPTSTPTPTMPTPTYSLTPPADLPAPQAGKAVIWGMVMWNGQPVAGAEVEIGTGITMYIGGGGTALDEPVFKTTTDSQGYYVLTDVTPGGYVRRFKAFGTWFYPDGQYLYHKFQINADQTVSKNIYHIIKSDLTLNTPADKADMAYDKVTLTWQAYPEARYYQVKLKPENQSAFEIDYTTGTAYTHPQPLLNGKYTWAISAYNQNGQQIVLSPDRNLTITGAAYSIYVEIVSPADDAIVSGSSLNLEWQAYPGAAYYKIYVAVSGGGDTIVSFVKVTETNYIIPQTLAPAEYYWTIYAYDSYDDEITQSTGRYFTVP